MYGWVGYTVEPQASDLKGRHLSEHHARKQSDHTGTQDSPHSHHISPQVLEGAIASPTSSGATIGGSRPACSRARPRGGGATGSANDNGGVYTEGFDVVDLEVGVVKLG